ncbi:hypothetical protein [Longispora albida]|uniref:hypothetical protein n=1 Tax=Longispora albida TaxID=203523 RepID=UPI00035E2915|nr:hypothetical protein [Longispora albida]
MDHDEDYGTGYPDGGYDDGQAAGYDDSGDHGAGTHHDEGPGYEDTHGDGLDGLDPDGDATGTFPPQLDFPAPEPVDGFPWADPALLGDQAGYTEPVEDPQAPEVLSYNGSEGGTWEDAVASEDPATSNLARFWQPGQ